MLSLHLVNSSPVLEYQDQEAPQMIDQPQKEWDKYGLGFGSDGFLYDFVKRTPTSKYNKYNGFGSDGYLYDFTKRRTRSSPYRPYYRKYNYGFGSDGYLYDFVRK